MTCIFCVPQDVIGENATCYARLDGYPAADGHTLIIPKRHVESLFELTSKELAGAWALLSATWACLEGEPRPDGYTIGVNEGRAAGRTVDHCHINLIPRRHGDVPDPRGGIRKAIPTRNPDEWAP
jgi:diadenosine tetraphosphate (Ap4A) HIT family hydrolase